MAEFIVILNSRAAVKSFMAAGSLTLGGNMSIAAGPIGRNFEGTGTINTKGKVSAMYSYSRTKGLFGGASLEGSAIIERSDANAKAYGYSVTAKQLLSGAVEVPPFADMLIETIQRRTGNTWVENEEDDVSYEDINRPYAFGSEFASGSNSVRSKTKRSLSDLMTRSRSGSGSSLPSTRERSDSGSMRLPVASSSSRFATDFASDDHREPRPNAKVKAKVKSPFDDPDEDRLTPRDTFGRESFESLDDPESRYGAFSPPRETIDEPEREDYGFHVPPAAAATTTTTTKRNLLMKKSAKMSPTSSRTRPRGLSGASNTKPWDSEDEDLIGEEKSTFDMHRMNRSLSESTVTPSTPTTGLGHGIALFDFAGVEPGDLPFKKNDVVTIIKKDDEEWLTGRLGMREGVVPRNYLELHWN